MFRISCLWPGLSRLWYQADLLALAEAVAFALLLNAALWVTFIVPHAPAGRGRWAAWLVIAGWWCASLVRTARSERSGTKIAGSEGLQDLFIRAQVEYLKGRWSEASCLLEKLIQRNPGDVESQLLLASVLRRTGRFDVARRQLCRLERLDGAEKWHGEILRERGMLESASR